MMCNYTNGNNCLITGEICPFVYWCPRRYIWKPSKNMPENCGVKERYEAPKGQYRVCDERKGMLYIDIDKNIIMLENPFDYIPKYVKLSKTKNGWKIRK